MTEDEAPTPSDHRWLATGLAVIAAVCLVFAALSKQWLYNPRTRSNATMGSFEYAFGPMAMSRCAAMPDGGEATCESMSNGDLVDDFRAEIAGARKRAESLPEGTSQDLMIAAQAEATVAADTLQTSGAFAPLGWITAVSCLVAALSLVIITLLTTANRRVLWPVMPTTTALLGVAIGLVCGCVFVAVKPGAAGFVGVSYGFWVFGGGCVLGLAAATLLNKHIRPVDVDLLEDSMDPENY
jgi:hypothetical protein